jgi:putative ABC transport system ATP-binding protein
MAFILEARKIDVAFGDAPNRVLALRGVHLSLSRGEFLAIMGRSGSGKSTLLHVLGGMVVPRAGQVLLDGEDLAAMSDNRRTIVRRTRLGFVFQAFNLLPTLTAEENVAMPLILDGLAVATARKRAAEALEQVAMGHRRNGWSSQLSGGEQQRVAIARAIVINPAILLADEPTGNLDSVQAGEIAALLRSFVDEGSKTVVLVTHDSQIASVADRVLRLSDGQIVDGESGMTPSHFAEPTPS